MNFIVDIYETRILTRNVAIDDDKLKVEILQLQCTYIHYN